MNTNNLTQYEYNVYTAFKSGHVCHDRELHDGIKFDVEVYYSFKSGIGSNMYIRCLRCGSQIDATDYGAW